MGENGAGKSTLIKILTGAYLRTSGTIRLQGREYSAYNPREARQKGVATLFQELNVVDTLTVEENLTLGVEDISFGFLRKSKKIRKMLEVLKSIEPSIEPKQKVAELSVAKKQIVEIAKAVASEADVIIMDEPTAAISEGEIKRLFRIIKALKEQNVTVIYISHRLDEIFEIGDTVTVMRDGKHIATKPVAEVQNRSELIRMMIGKAVFEQYYPEGGPVRGAAARGRPPLQRQTARHLLQREARGDRRVLRAGRRRQDRAGAGDFRRGPLHAARSASRTRSWRPARPARSPPASPWCRRKGGRRGCSRSSPSAATSPS